ncbi:MAG: hypothetical protein ABJF80_02150 [Marinomonas sp.]|uniref:hypothetical protein n=1 Tax=Parasphingorhabdus sp. TaxID=2709688 RepID=UPI00327D0B19
MQLNGCDVERQTADPTEIDAPLVRSAVENGREPLIDNLGEQDAMKKVTDVVAKQSSESAAELEEFFRGKQLERRLHQPSPVRLEYFKRNGSWSMFVEEIVATQYDGKWRVSQTDDGRAIICVIRLKKDSQPITNSTEECRDVRISKDDGILSISMPGHRSLVSDYDFSEL